MTKNLITQMNKKIVPLRAKNDVTHACTSVEIARSNEQKADLKW